MATCSGSVAATKRLIRILNEFSPSRLADAIEAAVAVVIFGCAFERRLIGFDWLLF